jgi:hypothetical protein
MCPFCGGAFPHSELPAHSPQCPKLAAILSGGSSAGAAGGGGSGSSSAVQCPFCSATFSLAELAAHSPCPKLPSRFAGGSAPMHVLLGGFKETDDALVPCQRAALDYVHSQSRVSSAAAMAPLKARFAALGEEGLLERTLAYVRDRAPIIIHFTPEVFHLLATDTHYRSQFETGTSKGSLSRQSREQWEKTLFNGAYTGAPDAERPKYGCLNMSGDTRGVVSAHHYGVLFMMLKDSCRSRCTFTSADSGQLAVQGAAAGGVKELSTCEHYAHILSKYSDDELRRIVAVAAKGASVSGMAGAAGSVYKECQVHGPVRLGVDIGAVVIPEAYRAQCQADSNTFASKHGVSILWV